MKTENSNIENQAGGSALLPAVAFGSKCRFKDQINLHPKLQGKDFCLLGYCDSAIALIEWEKRGEYNFEFYSGSINDLVLSTGNGR